MRGEDISGYTAKIDYLFQCGVESIGIGDGGNEIGMGNVLRGIVDEGLPVVPCVTEVDRLLIATVSNWGAYGLVAGLDRDVGLGIEERVVALLEEAGRYGIVDGVTGELGTEDGFGVEVTREVIGKLVELVNE